MDDALTELRRELAGRYEVEHELGHGGMAVVYLAKDLRHDRKVAIKVLRQDVGGASGGRFLREIRTVAQLHHPHILQLLDSGTAGDHLFYVMPYVEGETVRQKLEREGPLSIDEAVRIAREVADALSYAHARGIVHRDIKPENIFLSAGHALVADFGIARAAESAAGPTTTLTDAGLAVGTPSYMSPEQATAEPRIDGRSDQYALGCVLYEMLAGAPPFTGPTSQAIMARHTADPVPPLRTVRDVPATLENAINRALAKMPADRWPDAKTFAENLERVQTQAVLKRSQTASQGRQRPIAIGLAAAVVAIAVFAAWPFRMESRNTSAADSRLAVAIAPFNYNDSTAASFADGVREQLLSALFRLEGLSLPGVANSRLLSVRESGEDPREVARSLPASRLVIGDVVVRGTSYRVYPKIIDVEDGTLIWQHTFEGELGEKETLDLFRIQDDMAEKIAAALLPTLAPEQRGRLARGVRTKDREAWELYLQARRGIDERSAEGLTRALGFLDRAVRKDSTFADAWVARAEALNWMPVYLGTPQAEAAAGARRSLGKALELDPSNGLAIMERGWHSSYDRSWDEAWRDMRAGLKLSPGSADAEHQYALFLSFVNEPDSSVAHARQAVQLDPSNALYWASLGRRFAFARMFDSAVVASRQAVSLNPANWVAVHTLVYGYRATGRAAEAESAGVRFQTLVPQTPVGLAHLAEYYGTMGNTNGVRQILERLTDMAETTYVSPTAIGLTRLAVGDRAGALEALELAAQQYETELITAIAFRTTSLRGDPRFEKIRKRVFGDRPLPYGYWP